MKKILLIFAVIMCSISCSSKIFSQTNWFWQSPLPTGNTLIRVDFINGKTGFAVGANFTAIKTTDGGMNWFSINTNFDSVPSGVILNNSLSSVFFINSETGFIGGNNLFKTTDGGNRWVYINTPFTPIVSVFFTENSIGYVTGEGIAKTSDGGYTWSVLITGLPAVELYESISFPCKDTGYVSSYGIPSSIIRTNNGGINWSVTYSINERKHFYGIEFPENSTGFVSPYSGGYIMKTTDRGNSWIDLLYTSYITSLSFSSVSTGYAYGEDGAFYSTSNGGANWNYSNIEIGGSIDFPSSDTGYLVGLSGLIWKTTNSGILWETNQEIINNLNSIDFISENSGFIAGNDGTFLKTTNGGINWMNLSSDFNYDFNYIKFFDEYTGYLCGEIVLKTTDGGLNWDSIAFFLQPHKIQFIDSNTGYIVPSYTYNIYKTTDAGLNWSYAPIPSIEGSRISFHFINPYVGYLTYSTYIGGFFNSEQQIYKTFDGGVTWQYISNFTTYHSINYINFANEQTGFLNGPAGLYKTTNSGVTWSYIWNEWLSKPLYIFNSEIAYLPTFLGQHYRSTNEGINWSEQLNIFNASFNSTFYTDYNTGYIIGNNGLILKTTNGGGLIIGVNDVNTNIPARFSLEQNYPNPFNPNTKITFFLPQNADVKLIVYDLLGREVRSIVNEQLSPGKYTFDFDGSDLPSGVYYYKLTTDKFSETRKMVLLK